jgi:iron complex transport system ATP-binding protein
LSRKTAGEQVKIDLLGNRVSLVLKDNVLAVIADAELSTVSGAIYNGGFRKTKAILNMEVPEEYGDRRLHDDPLAFVKSSAEKLELKTDFLSLITAAKIKNFALAGEEKDGITVKVVATAGCSHAESAGEEICAQQVVGTINVIVVIDATPSESCLVAALATAVEAKASAMRELDIRSRYTGQQATGTITDSLVMAATNAGRIVNLAGPASLLGQLVAHSTKRAVKDAIAKQGESLPPRSIVNRMKERHLSTDLLAAELSRIKTLNSTKEEISLRLANMICNDPLFGEFLLAAAKMDEEAAMGLVPQEFTKPKEFGIALGSILLNKIPSQQRRSATAAEIDSVNLPANVKQVLIAKLGITGH